jgi:outer membrane protein assembly factor BamD
MNRVLPMRLFPSLLVFLSLFLFSCKSDFEKVRASGDVQFLTKKSLEYYNKAEYQKAQTVFELIMPSLKGQDILEEISYKYAYTHYYLKSYFSANFYFRSFANTFGNSKLREDAEFMAAFSDFKQSPKYRLDQDNTQKAIDGFQLFVNTFPESPRVKECNKLIDELRKKLEKKAFEEGSLYFSIEQYQSAIQVLENLLKDFPETPDAEEIRFKVLKSSYLWAENSIFEKKKERYQLVAEKHADFLSKFPKSKYKREAEIFLKDSNKKIQELSNVRYQNKSTRS